MMEASMNNDLHLSHARALTRRQFFCQTGLSLGAVALGGLLSREGYAGVAPALRTTNPLEIGRASCRERV